MNLIFIFINVIRIQWKKCPRLNSGPGGTEVGRIQEINRDLTWIFGFPLPTHVSCRGNRDSKIPAFEEHLLHFRWIDIAHLALISKWTLQSPLQNCAPDPAGNTPETSPSAWPAWPWNGDRGGYIIDSAWRTSLKTRRGGRVTLGERRGLPEPDYIVTVLTAPNEPHKSSVRHLSSKYACLEHLRTLEKWFDLAYKVSYYL